MKKTSMPRSIKEIITLRKSQILQTKLKTTLVYTISRVCTYRELSSHTKVSQFGMALGVEQDVARFDIAVDFASQMKVL